MSDSGPNPGSATSHPLVLVNARAYTGDERRPWMDAVLVREGAIAAIGSSAELRKRAGASGRVIDARGLLALSRAPGGALRAGTPADLVLVDRAPQGAASGDEIVFALEGGRIVLDRLALSGEEVP